MPWYVVTRRYTVEDGVYVEAESKTDARRKVEDGEYDDVTPYEVVSPTTMPRAKEKAFEDLPSDIQFKEKYGEYPR